MSVALGGADFLHALRERKQRDFVADSRLASGAVGDGAGDVLGGGERGEQEHDQELGQ